jgi:hypothetical protein
VTDSDAGRVLREAVRQALKCHEFALDGFFETGIVYSLQFWVYIKCKSILTPFEAAQPENSEADYAVFF